MHSKHDGAVPLEHVTYAHRHISDSKIYILESWGHLIWIGKGSTETTKVLVDFLTYPNKLMLNE